MHKQGNNNKKIHKFINFLLFFTIGEHRCRIAQIFLSNVFKLSCVFSQILNRRFFDLYSNKDFLLQRVYSIHGDGSNFFFPLSQQETAQRVSCRLKFAHKTCHKWRTRSRLKWEWKYCWRLGESLGRQNWFFIIHGSTFFHHTKTEAEEETYNNVFKAAKKSWIRENKKINSGWHIVIVCLVIIKYFFI